MLPSPTPSTWLPTRGRRINLKDVEMKLIIQKIADWTGKVVIPTDEIMKEKITIYSPGRLPRNEALEQIYGALRMKGYTAEYSGQDDLSETHPGCQDRDRADDRAGSASGGHREQGADRPEVLQAGQLQPGQMVQIVQPLIGEYGHISTDEPTSSLLVIDTVRNLMRIETMIAQFDVPRPSSS